MGKINNKRPPLTPPGGGEIQRTGKRGWPVRWNSLLRQLAERAGDGVIYKTEIQIQNRY